MSKGNAEKIIPSVEEDEMQSWIGLGKSSQSRTLQADSEAESEKVILSLRPDNFEEYIGQSKVKENLQIACNAASNRKEAMDHVLLHGPPGLGKTSLASIIAKKLGVGFKSTSGPVIEKPGDLAAILTSLQPYDVLFIDEIHRLSRVVEEVLYPAMEDFKIDILIGQGPAAKSIKIDLKPFTLVGATTRTGLLTSPLRDRFGLAFRMEYYKPEELLRIVSRSAGILKVEIETDAAFEIAKRSRGTPRIANRILKRVRDYADYKKCHKISVDIASEALQLLEIDNSGLDKMDRVILQIIIEKFSGGPVGVDTLSAAIGEEPETIEDVYEPFLLQEGYLARTRRGREATALAYKHLGIKLPDNSQLGLKF